MSFIKKRNLYFGILMLGACTPTHFPRLPCQGRAEEIVWYQTYKAPVSPPEVEWIEDDHINCGNGFGFYRGNFPGDLITTKCVTGEWWSYWNYAQVAHPTNEKYNGTAYAHEMYHAYQQWVLGMDDPDHKDPNFGPGGLVEQANKNLNQQIACIPEHTLPIPE